LVEQLDVTEGFTLADPIVAPDGPIAVDDTDRVELRVIGSNLSHGCSANLAVVGDDFGHVADGNQELASLPEHLCLPLRAETDNFGSACSRGG
jgi:hypothetical protein